jgi:hypothetical protein
VHIFTCASRAAMACRLAMPGNPAFNARAGLGHGPLGCPLARGLGWRASHPPDSTPELPARGSPAARSGRLAEPEQPEQPGVVSVASVQHILVDTAGAEDGPYCSSLSCGELVDWPTPDARVVPT